MLKVLHICCQPWTVIDFLWSLLCRDCRTWLYQCWITLTCTPPVLSFSAQLRELLLYADAYFVLFLLFSVSANTVSLSFCHFMEGFLSFPYWRGVNATHSSPDSAVFFTCVDSPPMCCQLLSNTHTAPELFLQHPPKADRLGMGKRLGMNTARTADPSWHRGYPIPYNLLSNKS